jgi:hypothetical protein
MRAFKTRELTLARLRHKSETLNRVNGLTLPMLRCIGSPYEHCLAEGSRRIVCSLATGVSRRQEPKAAPINVLESDG